MIIKKKYIHLIATIIIFGCQKDKIFLPKKIVLEEHFGRTIEDPYRNAENLEDSKVKKWIDIQNTASKGYLKEINKTNYLIEKQKEFDSKRYFTTSHLKVTPNNMYFYLKRLASENVAKLYFRNSFEGEEEILYDPKNFKERSNTEYVINYIEPNWNGTKIAISLTEKGKEISEIVVIDTKSKKQLSKIISNAWPSGGSGIQWLPNNNEFIYLHYPIVNPKNPEFLKNTKSIIYTLSNEKEDFTELFSKENNKTLNIKEEDFPIVSINSEQDKFIIGQTTGAFSYYDAYYLSLNDIKTKNWKPLFKKSDQIKDFMVVGDSLIYRTSKNAPNFKLCITSITNPEFNNPKVLVEEKKDLIITDFAITNEALFFVTSKNGIKASLFKLKNNIQKEVKLPKMYGSLSIESKGINYPELSITAVGWLTDNKRLEYKNNVVKKRELSSIPENILLNDFVVEEVEVTAHDGEKIPLSLIYKRGMKRNAANSVLMDGYGAYGIPMRPSFSMRRLLWVLEGGVYAIAHVRGGGEKGEAWHKGGFKTTKPNTWKDFISCAEYLIDNKFTSRNKLAILSGSAGGILIGRSITERPDLFKAAIVEFGSLNMLRSENRPNGANNVKEFGTVKDSLEFEALREMDAYHHIKIGEKYPATLLTAGLNDPRVPAWFSVKFAARMQAANASNNPNLLLIDSETGHGIDNTKLKEYDRFANIVAFALWQTGHPEYQPKE